MDKNSDKLFVYKLVIKFSDTIFSNFVPTLLCQSYLSLWKIFQTLCIKTVYAEYKKGCILVKLTSIKYVFLFDMLILS